MSGFLYFAAGHTTPVTGTVVDALGLRYAFEQPPSFGEISGRTPSGQTGTLMCRVGDDPTYSADAQVWRKRPGDDCVWVGYRKGAPPTPADLLRDRTLRGKHIELGDGAHWTVPTLMVFDDAHGFVIDLPCRADLDAQGQWMNGETLPEYRDHHKFADRLYEGMVLAELGKAARLTTAELLDMTCEILAINYRVSKLEVAMLGLLAVDKTLKDVAMIAANWDRFLDWAEKKSAESSLAGLPG